MRQLVDDVDTDGSPANLIITAEISVVEVAAALAIIHRTGRIWRSLRDAAYDRYLKEVAGRYRILPITTAVLHRAATLTQEYPLKGYDAVQMAAALAARAVLSQPGVPLLFVAGDRQLVSAAGAEGLDVANPFDYAHLGRPVP